MPVSELICLLYRCTFTWLVWIMKFKRICIIASTADRDWVHQSGENWWQMLHLSTWFWHQLPRLLPIQPSHQWLDPHFWQHGTQVCLLYVQFHFFFLKNKIETYFFKQKISRLVFTIMRMNFSFLLGNTCFRQAKEERQLGREDGLPLSSIKDLVIVAYPIVIS